MCRAIKLLIKILFGDIASAIFVAVCACTTRWLFLKSSIDMICTSAQNGFRALNSGLPVGSRKEK